MAQGARRKCRNQSPPRPLTLRLISLRQSNACWRRLSIAATMRCTKSNAAAMLWDALCARPQTGSSRARRRSCRWQRSDCDGFTAKNCGEPAQCGVQHGAAHAQRQRPLQAQCIATRPCNDAARDQHDRSRRRAFGVENRWRKSRPLSLAFCNDRRRSRPGIAPGADRSPLVARLDDAGQFVAERSGSGEERPSDLTSTGTLRAPRFVPQGSCASAAIILGSAASAWAFPHWFECFHAGCLRPLAQERCFSSVVICYYTIFNCIWQNEPTKILRNQEIPKHRPASAFGYEQHKLGHRAFCRTNPIAALALR